MRTTASVDSWIVGSGTLSTRTSRLPCQASAFNSSPSLAFCLSGSFSNPPYVPGTSSPKLVHLHKPALISGLFTGVRRRGILRSSPSDDAYRAQHRASCRPPDLVDPEHVGELVDFVLRKMLVCEVRT